MNKQYLMYVLSQLMKKKEPEGPFTTDETASRWHKETDVEILKKFCPEGYEMAKKHGHFLVGKAMDGSYIGIPGRFLLKEQPAGGRTGFTLWQPLRGGEEMYGDLDTISEEEASLVYGYWIARVDERTLRLSEV